MPDVADNRDYPGMRPFAEPGQSISNVGPCGQENYGNMVNWNQPHDNWGFDTVASYNAGDVIDVEVSYSEINTFLLLVSLFLSLLYIPHSVLSCFSGVYPMQLIMEVCILIASVKMTALSQNSSTRTMFLLKLTGPQWKTAFRLGF
jgi:hypothetical protein